MDTLAGISTGIRPLRLSVAGAVRLLLLREPARAPVYYSTGRGPVRHTVPLPDLPCRLQACFLNSPKTAALAPV